VRNTVVTTQQPARFHHGPERIEFLAEMRNQALLPLYESKETFDQLVFVNDVLFCAQEVLRWAASTGGCDMESQAWP
jgi:hypothetical protein